MTAFQGTSVESIVRLLNGGSPVTGVAFGDATVKFRKQGAGAGALSTKTLTIDNWLEIELGFYALIWSSADMDTLGTFLYQVTESGSDPINDNFTIEPQPISLQAQQNLCIVSGNVVDIGGEAALGTTISFRLAKSPIATASSLLRGELLRTAPDFFGNFSIALLRNISVVIEIERAGIRQQIDIPDQSTAQILDLLPPIT